MADPPEIKVTAGAQRALGLAELVNKVFKADRVPSTATGHGGYRVEMAGPEGPSTSDGKGGLDRLLLIPVETPAGATRAAGATITIGTADPNLSQLEIRTYDGLQAVHAQQFKGESLPIDRAGYDVLRKKIEQFFDRQGITTVEAAPPAAAPAPFKLPVPALIATGILVIIVVIAFVLRAK